MKLLLSLIVNLFRKKIVFDDFQVDNMKSIDNVNLFRKKIMFHDFQLDNMKSEAFLKTYPHRLLRKNVKTRWGNGYVLGAQYKQTGYEVSDSEKERLVICITEPNDSALFTPAYFYTDDIEVSDE